MNTKLITLVAIFAIAAQVNTKSYSNGASIKRLEFFLNKARNDPKWAADRIQEIWINNMEDYKNYGIALFRPKMLLYSKTVTWFKDAKTWLMNKHASGIYCNSSQNYVSNEGFTRASWDHSKYQITQKAHSMTHYGKTGQTPNVYKMSDRSKVYNNWVGGATSWAENVCDEVGEYANTDPKKYGGTWESAEFAVLSWIVDHNVASLGHRLNIYKCDLTLSGMGIYPYTKSNGKKADRLTHMMAKGDFEAKSFPFSKSIRNQICWTSFEAGRNDCTDQ
jgi:hypothetical protein